MGVRIYLRSNRKMSCNIKCNKYAVSKIGVLFGKNYKTYHTLAMLARAACTPQHN